MDSISCMIIKMPPIKPSIRNINTIPVEKVGSDACRGNEIRVSSNIRKIIIPLNYFVLIGYVYMRL